MRPEGCWDGRWPSRELVLPESGFVALVEPLPGARSVLEMYDAVGNLVLVSVTTAPATPLVTAAFRVLDRRGCAMVVAVGRGAAHDPRLPTVQARRSINRGFECRVFAIASYWVAEGRGAARSVRASIGASTHQMRLVRPA
jgi:hypothetical protein